MNAYLNFFNYCEFYGNLIKTFLYHKKIAIPMVDKEQVVEVLKKVYDPEIQYDIYSLGLVYDVGIEGNKVKILMTLTSPMCPYGPQLMDDVRRQVSAIDGVGEVELELTFSPAWNPDKMTEEAKIALGI